MSKQVLILSTDNSTNSIIAEAVLTKYLHGAITQSCGLKPISAINPNVKKVLQENNLWSDEYHPKSSDSFLDNKLDLVVIICEKAAKKCPNFTSPVDIIQIDYEDISKEGYTTFKTRLKEIQMELLPIVRMHLGL